MAETVVLGVLLTSLLGWLIKCWQKAFIECNLSYESHIYIYLQQNCTSVFVYDNKM